MMITKRVMTGLVLAGLVITSLQAADKTTSLRSNPLQEDPIKSDLLRWQSDREPITRNYVQQPPLIPHKIIGYKINLNANKCLTCHSWSNYKQSGATKISQTHFTDRDGTELANVSARRYFCNQCHVPQVEARPIVENTFEPVSAVKPRR